MWVFERVCRDSLNRNRFAVGFRGVCFVCHQIVRGYPGASLGNIWWTERVLHDDSNRTRMYTAIIFIVPIHREQQIQSDRRTEMLDQRTTGYQLTGSAKSQCKEFASTIMTGNKEENKEGNKNGWKKVAVECVVYRKCRLHGRQISKWIIRCIDSNPKIKTIRLKSNRNVT